MNCFFALTLLVAFVHGVYTETIRWGSRWKGFPGNSAPVLRTFLRKCRRLHGGVSAAVREERFRRPRNPPGADRRADPERRLSTRKIGRHRPPARPRPEPGRVRKALLWPQEPRYRPDLPFPAAGLESAVLEAARRLPWRPGVPVLKSLLWQTRRCGPFGL